MRKWLRSRSCSEMEWQWLRLQKKLGISDGTVRSWKNRYGWGDKSKKQTQRCKKGEKGKCNIAKEKAWQVGEFTICQKSETNK